MRGDLYILRKEKGLTQQEVADYIGMSRVNYNRFELGKVQKMKYKDKVLLADKLGITMDELNDII